MGLKNFVAIAITGCLLLCASSARAADGARFRAIGFSPDDRYFAFEQYGVQDGSGFAYTDIFVLDMREDTWVPGSPIHVLDQNEPASLAAARDEAHRAATSLLKSLAITEPAELLAANPFTEVVADRGRLRFHNHFNFAMGILGNPEDQGTFELVVKPHAIPKPAQCGEGYSDAAGLLLELRNNKTSVTTAIHRDVALPQSRGCPFAYDIEAVVQRSASPEPKSAVAIVGYHSHGFEGANRRFLAFPFEIE